jgi:hypothetical protein
MVYIACHWMESVMSDIDAIVRDGCFVLNEAFSEEISRAVFYNKHFNNPFRIERPVHLFFMIISQWE